MTNTKRPQEVSAGGVVFREFAGRVEIALIQIDGRWHLPKGGPTVGETMEQTALREVKEETHIDAALLDYIHTIEYTFLSRGNARRPVDKSVHFYLMRYVGSEIRPQLSEVDDAAWKGIDDALNSLTYENERDVVARAREIINLDK